MLQDPNLYSIVDLFPFELDGQLAGINHGSLKLNGSRLIVDVALREPSAPR